MGHDRVQREVYPGAPGAQTCPTRIHIAGRVFEARKNGPQRETEQARHTGHNHYGPFGAPSPSVMELSPWA